MIFEQIFHTGAASIAANRHTPIIIVEVLNSTLVTFGYY